MIKAVKNFLYGPMPDLAHGNAQVRESKDSVIREVNSLYESSSALQRATEDDRRH